MQLIMWEHIRYFGLFTYSSRLDFLEYVIKMKYAGDVKLVVEMHVHFLSFFAPFIVFWSLTCVLIKILTAMKRLIGWISCCLADIHTNNIFTNIQTYMHTFIHTNTCAHSISQVWELLPLRWPAYEIVESAILQAYIHTHIHTSIHL